MSHKRTPPLPGAGPWFAVIDPASPLRAEWLEGFGTDVVEVERPVPVPCRMPDGSRGRVYIARWQSLRPAQLARVCALMGPKFGLTPLEAALDIGRYGIPIVDADVRVGTDPDAVRASFAGEETSSDTPWLKPGACS